MRSEILKRGWLLFEQNRPEMALDFAHQALAEDVNDADAHRLLALCLLETQKYRKDKDLRQSLDSAQLSVQLEPDNPYSQYVLAIVYTELQDWNRAGKTIAEVLERDPSEPEFWNLSAVVHMHFNRWQKALEDLDRGLQQDPQNVTLQTNRVRCLVSMGRKEEVTQTLEAALHRNPEDADVHVSQGYALLHAGKYREAMQHFGEALRLHPMSASARVGMLEAMRARNPVYAVLLRFFLWMTRFDTKTQLAIVIGGVVGVRIVYNLLDNISPLLAIVVIYSYMVFVLLTWVAHPMVNLILRLDREARHLLSDEEVAASNFMGGLVLMALGGLGAAIALRELVWLGISGAALCLMLPVNGMMTASRAWARIVFRCYWAGMALLVAVALALIFYGQSSAAEGVLYMVLLGTVAYSWISSFITSLS